MDNIISDQTKFNIISEPSHKFALKIEDKINNFLRKLKNLKLLSEDLYRELHVSGSSPGVLYGLPTVHKSNFGLCFPFRPTIAAYNTPSFNLAKVLVDILNPFTHNDFTVANSHSFISEITVANNASIFLWHPLIWKTYSKISYYLKRSVFVWTCCSL